MVSFSERYGYKPIKQMMQLECVDPPLLNGLWTACTVVYWDVWERNTEYDTQHPRATETEALARCMWLNYFKESLDTLPEFRRHHSSTRSFMDILRDRFFHCGWNEVFDLIEFVVQSGPMDRTRSFTDLCNRCFTTEKSPYRLVNQEVTPIVNETEIASIEEASTSRFKLANDHLSAAIRLLSDRRTPDYRNSIKESISAVEGVCATTANKKSASLGDALKQLDGSMHPALSKAFSSLYGWTSDADGIRHALMEEPNLTFADAKFMLVACSAFINYMIEKTSEVVK